MSERERERERESTSDRKIEMTHINIPECYKKLSLFFATTKFYSWMQKFHLRGVLGYLRKYEGRWGPLFMSFIAFSKNT